MFVNLKVKFLPGATIEDLDLLTMRLKNLEEPLIAIGKLIQEIMAVNFETEGQGTWPPLKASTILRKLREGLDPYTASKPLVRSGTMMGDALGNQWQISPFASGFKGTLEVPGYSSFHFDSTKFMPKRDYAFVPLAALPQVSEIVKRWILGY